MPPKSNRTQASRRRKKKAPEGFLSRHGMPLMIAGIASSILLVGAAMLLLQRYSGERAATLFIDSTATTATIRTMLSDSLGRTYGTKVYTLWRLQGGRPGSSCGFYVVEPGHTVFNISRRIAKGRQNPVSVTFNNIRTIPQLTARLSRQLRADSASLSLALDTILGSEGIPRSEYPVYLLPDTYSIYWNSRPGLVISKIVKASKRFWTDERVEKAKQLGLTPAQVVTVASIVEEETARKAEMPTVARLYLNRLHKGMKLQADPTVKFAIGDFSIRRITADMLGVKSPYNTYRHAGLPPGPIRLPSASTIDAVLDAPEHPYLYMCAREDFSGFHNFATDYSTHQANARRYQAELNRRNIH